LITYKIYKATKELPSTWDNIVKHDIFLQSHYFKALENASPNNITWYYIGVFNKNELVGVAIIQRAQLYLKNMFRTKSSSTLKQVLINSFSKILKGNILVLGNLMHTGQHGLFFDQNKISQTDFLNILFKAINKLKIEIKTTQNKKIRSIMMKDFFTDDAIHTERGFLNTHQLHKVKVQPNMMMDIKTNWQNWEDYRASLNKKYKRRYNRAKKKFGEIKPIELDLETIHDNSKRLYKLYKNVSDNAKFNTFVLPQNHFYNLKEQLKDNFKVFGYYLDNKLIGFYTLILNNKALETYFLGYDKEHQYPNQLYLNMLYDMARFAIENKFSSVVYARTAMEIKSSVGADSREMIMYMKHTNNLANAILRKVFRLMKPSQKWIERHPFKE